MSEGGAQSGIQVKTGFRPLAFLLYLCKTRLVIDDGEAMARPWGETFIPVTPGRHTVRCWFRYLYLSKAGNSTVTVDVLPGQVVSVGYRAPWFMFSPGKWTLNGALTYGGPAVTSSPSWYPDPARRHQLRFWDGRAWTEQVSDNGATSIDPV